MTLTPEDLAKLNYHLIGHPLVIGLTSSETASWYTQVPNSELTQLVKVLTASDRAKFFACTNFPSWYAQFCQKIISNTTIKIFGLTNEQIDLKAVELLSGILQRQLTEHSMQKLVQDMLTFKFDELLTNLLICLGADGKFDELTLVRLNIELAPYPRWMSLGLSSPPTELDCEI